MYVGRDFSVSDGGFELEAYGFDFAPAIANPVDKLVSAAFGLSAVSGADPGAQSKAVGTPTIKGQAATIAIGGLLPGVKYRLQCVATFGSGSQLSLYSFVSVQALATS